MKPHPLWFCRGHDPEKVLICRIEPYFVRERCRIVKQRTITHFVFPLMALALLVFALARPLNADAASRTHVMGIKSSGHATTPFAGSNLTYHGGPVQGGTTHVYAIFWEPTGSTVSSTYNSLIKRYFGDVGGSGLYAINKQYTDSSGRIPSNSTLAGSWVDTKAYPSGTLSDANIQSEVTRAKSANGWSSSLTNIFFVFTAKNENICDGGSCSFSTFCAYHSYFGSNTIYAAMPYTGTNLSACGVPVSPNNDFNADSTINVTSHEQNEAATDPLLNAWYDSSGAENGDKCAWNFGSYSSSGNVTWNGHHYIVQQEWDNAKRGCALTGP